MISIEMFVLVLLAGIILFTIFKGLIFVALLIGVVVVAYYTGMASAFLDLVLSLLPVTMEDPEVAMSIVSTILIA